MHSQRTRVITIASILVLAAAVAAPSLAADDDEKVRPGKDRKGSAVQSTPDPADIAADTLRGSLAPTRQQSPNTKVRGGYFRSAALQLLEGITGGVGQTEERQASPMNPGVGVPPGQGGDIPGQGATPPDHSSGQGNGRPAKEDKDKDKDKGEDED